MKKFHCFIALLLAVFLLSACSPHGGNDWSGPISERGHISEETVPDSLVYSDIDSIYSNFDTFQKNLYSNMCCGKAKNIVSHTPDSETHIDTVYVEFCFEFDYCTETFGMNLEYQYSRSDDTWTCIRSENPQLVDVTFDDEFLSGWVFSDSEYKYGDTWEWNIEIISLDTNAETVTVSYDITNYYNSDSINWCDTETIPVHINDTAPFDSELSFYVPCGYYIGEEFYDYYIHIEITYCDMFEHAVIYNGYEYK